MTVEIGGTLEAGELKRIHVNRQHIAQNANNKTNKPVLTCKCGARNLYGHHIEIDGHSEVIYGRDNPLSCGARLWIETTAEVRVFVDGEIDSRDLVEE